jgi:hypothetical protein
MPVFTLLSSRKPSRWILTDDKSVSGVLAAETPVVALVSMRVTIPVSGSPPTSTLLAVTTIAQGEKVIVSPVCGPPAGKEPDVTVKIHEPKVTPPPTIAVEPNLARMNIVEVLLDDRKKVKVTGLLPIAGLKTDPSGIVNCGGNDPSKARTLAPFRGTVALILRRSPVPPEQANSANELISTSTATIKCPVLPRLVCCTLFPHVVG